MSDHKYRKMMIRVDSPLFQRLGTSQQDEAVQQFQQLWEVQKQKISKILCRRDKVKINLSMQQDRQVTHNKQALQELKVKMERHVRKKSELQLEKIKTYRNSGLQWRDKVKEIAMQQKKESLKNFERVKELNKNVVQFFEKRHSPRSSKSSTFRPASQQGLSLRIKIPHESKSPRQNPSDFLTEIRVTIPKESHRPHYPSELSSAKKSHQSNTAAISRRHSPRLHKYRTQEIINPEMLKSKRESERKEEWLIQQAMEKVQKILKARKRINEQFKQVSKNIKQRRELRHNALLNDYTKSIQHPYSKIQRLQRMSSPKKIQIKRSITVSSPQNYQIKLRREKQQAQSFRRRTEQFGQQKLKQHRGRFHRMIRDAVSLYRLQTLRQKS